MTSKRSYETPYKKPSLTLCFLPPLPRSVYLSKQVSTRNRLLVLVDWLKAKSFGRDITRL